MGRFSFPDGTIITGEFKNDDVNGFATKTWTDGSVYEGEWRNGYEEGQGTRTYEDGDMWAGLWKDGKRNGDGVLFECLRDDDGNCASYSDTKGTWKNDREQ